MKKICFVVCYFGKLPDYFSMWLASAGQNETVDFLVVTDDKTSFCAPQNVKIVITDFECVKKRFFALFDFPVKLETAYKLCDYKPAYGEAFHDYLEGYDYWGYCDIDLVWGDIRTFLTDEILEQYPRVLTRGHCSLFRNNPEVNSMYRTLESPGCQSYRDVYQTASNRSYDEWAGHLGWGISEIFRKHGVLQYDEKIYLDPNFLKYRLTFPKSSEINAKSYIIEHRNGHLYAVFESGKREYMYFHFQKRAPIMKKFRGTPFVFLPPNEVRSVDWEVTQKDVKRWNGYKKIYWFPICFQLKKIKKIFKRG